MQVKRETFYAFLPPAQRGWYCFHYCLFMFVCLFVSLPVCQYDKSAIIRDIITKFSGHHPMVERADKFENGYIGVRGVADGDLTSLVF